jgi:hypothetical protein
LSRTEHSNKADDRSSPGDPTNWLRFRLLHDHTAHRTARTRQSHQDAETICRLLDTRNEGTLAAAAYAATVRVPLKHIGRTTAKLEDPLRYLPNCP